MVKQVLVIRKDLKMRRGKECAQIAHASMMWLSERVRTVRKYGVPIWLSEDEEKWINGSFTKVTVQVSSEEELFEIFNKAKESKLTVFMVTDSGKTEFNGVPTNTCCALGPNNAEEIDKITGHLKLY